MTVTGLAHKIADSPMCPERNVTYVSGRTCSCILQAGAYAGFNDLYHPGRQPGPMTEVAGWAHGRRKLLALAQLARAPIAAEAVRRITDHPASRLDELLPWNCTERAAKLAP